MNNRQSASKLRNLQPIPGFEKEYLISEDGEVWSIRSNKFLTPTKTKDGYLKVALNVKQRYDMKVHRLVAMTFLDTYGEEVNHIDANKLNNHYSNLEWCTHRYNVEHGTQLGLFKSQKPIRNKYRFTSVLTGASFLVIGIAAVQLHFGFKDKSIRALRDVINTGKPVKNGIMKGLIIDSVPLKDQRLFRKEVGSSEPKCVTSNKGEDIV